MSPINTEDQGQQHAPAIQAQSATGANIKVLILSVFLLLASVALVAKHSQAASQAQGSTQGQLTNQAQKQDNEEEGPSPKHASAKKLLSFSSMVRDRKYTVHAKKMQYKMGSVKATAAHREVISQSRLSREGESNVVDALKNNMGMSVEQQCSVCSARGISLNQMPSAFTTILVDGLPLYTSAASVYGLDTIGTNFIDSIEVSRGPGNAGLAFESLAGTVNIITKVPEKSEAIITSEVGSYNKRDLAGYIGVKEGDSASYILFSHKSRDFIDSDNNGISEAVNYSRKHVQGGFATTTKSGLKIKAHLSAGNEDRYGGAAIDNPNLVSGSNTGNPFDWQNTTNGANITFPSITDYDGGLNGISEIIKSTRVQGVLKFTRPTNFGALKLNLGTASYNQDSRYSGDIYQAKDTIYYAEGLAEFNLPKARSTITAGISSFAETLDSAGSMLDRTNNTYPPLTTAPDAFAYNSVGLLFAINTELIPNKLTLDVSTRAEAHNAFEGTFAPRVALSLSHDDYFTSRVSVGRGYKFPSSYFEFEHGILSVLNIERLVTKPETSNSVMYSLSYESDRLRANTSLSYAVINNISYIEIDSVNNIGQFLTSEHPVAIGHFDASLSYDISPKLTVELGAELNRFDFTQGNIAIARPNSRANIGATYQANEKLKLFGRANVVGRFDLFAFYGDRLNLDGTPKPDIAGPYVTIDLRAEYEVNEHLTLNAGAENLFGYVQALIDSQIFIDTSGELDVTNIWGPAVGTSLYIGFKLAM